MAAQGDVNSEMKVKRSVITERLQKRDEERLLSIQQRKATKQEAMVVEETTDFFKKEFDELQADIERTLADSEAIPLSERPTHFDGLALAVQKLQKLLTDSTQFLSPFSVQKAQDVVNQLKSSVEDKRTSALPKKKFAFRSDKKKTSEGMTCDKVDAAIKPVKAKTTANVHVDVCGFSEMSDAVMSKTREDVTGKHVTLSSLVNCTVRLYGSPTALHVNNLVNCKVFCGPISGSAFVDDCYGCVFVLSCQQLRVHTTTATEFYLHVTSRAIIEDCKAVSFAPYNWSYDQIDQDFVVSGLDRLRNNWTYVDDFNWLSSDVHSPNWSIIEEEKQVKNWE